MAKWSELHNGKFPDPYARLKLEEEVAKREREEREAKVTLVFFIIISLILILLSLILNPYLDLNGHYLISLL